MTYDGRITEAGLLLPDVASSSSEANTSQHPKTLLQEESLLADLRNNACLY